MRITALLLVSTLLPGLSVADGLVHKRANLMRRATTDTTTSDTTTTTDTTTSSVTTTASECCPVPSAVQLAPH